MAIDITVKIGGEAGQGIQTVGDLLAAVCRESGLYIMAINDFESRIRGGHSFFQIRISDKPVLAPNHQVNLLIALNQGTFSLHHDQLIEGGMAIVDSKESGTKDSLSIDMTGLAKEAGGRVMANTVAAGAALALMGAPFELYKNELEKRFSGKSAEITQNNIKAATLGYESVAGKKLKRAFEWKHSEPKGALLDGSKAAALGALAADCRLASFYPMSPATGILTALATLSRKFPMVVEQVEDELAAANLILGASFAGVRAMTATSGGGFCLMTEALGLAGITETPMVVVNAQRPGPATGLATRTEQADLLFAIRAAQDEFPRFVLAPGTAYEIFETMKRAFHLADKYQTPVIVLLDTYLTDSIFISEKPLKVDKNIDRFIVSDSDIKDPESYERYAFTEDGVSPRALPCQGEALVMMSGNEHTPDGHLTEDPQTRTQMVDKRNAKIPNMRKELSPPAGYHDNADLLLVGWGSSYGAIKESVDILREGGLDVGSLHFTDIWPFPSDEVNKLLGNGKKFLMVELNSTAQLGQLIREQTGLLYNHSILKYDGRPFYPIDIATETKKIISNL